MDRSPSKQEDSPSPPAGMPVRGAIFDCLGTLVELEPPGPRLASELGAAGIEIDDDRAAAAFRAEIDYYLRHHLEGRDACGLASLRERCARVLREALGLGPEEQGSVREAMLAALRFRPYDDAIPCLRELRREGVRVVVASNWDCSLTRTLDRVGIPPLIAGVVTSAEVGAAKPDPALLGAALRIARVRADEALAVGDSIEHDVAAARRAGVRAVLVRRDGTGDAPPTGPGVVQVRTLADALSVVLESR